MKRYESSIPRVACAIAGLAMTTITIGLFVVMPALMQPEDQTFSTAQVEKSLATTKPDAATGSV